MFAIRLESTQCHGAVELVRQRAKNHVRRPRYSLIGQHSTVSVALALTTFLEISVWRMFLSWVSPSALRLSGSLAVVPAAGVRPSASSRGVAPR